MVITDDQWEFIEAYTLRSGYSVNPFDLGVEIDAFGVSR